MSPTVSARILQRGRMVAAEEEEATNPVPWDQLLENGEGILDEDGGHMSIEH